MEDIERSNLARTIKKYRKLCEICTKYIFYREKVDNNCAMCYDWVNLKKKPW